MIPGRRRGQGGGRAGAAARRGRPGNVALAARHRTCDVAPCRKPIGGCEPAKAPRSGRSASARWRRACTVRPGDRFRGRSMAGRHRRQGAGRQRRPGEGARARSPPPRRSPVPRRQRSRPSGPARAWTGAAWCLRGNDPCPGRGVVLHPVSARPRSSRLPGILAGSLRIVASRAPQRGQAVHGAAHRGELTARGPVR